MLPAVGRAVPALLLATVAVGCGGDEGGKQSSEPASEKSADAGPGWGEEITVGVGLTMTVQEPQAGESGRVDVLVAAKNSSFSDGSIDLFLQCAGSYESGPVVTDASTPTPALTSGSVPADSSVEGYVSLTLPRHDGEVVESCEEDTISLVVPGFVEDAVYPIGPELAEGLLSGT